MKILTSLASTLALSLGLACAAQAATVYSNDFSGGANGFTGAAVTTAPSGESFYGILSFGSTASLSLSGFGGGEVVQIVFDLYTLATMDGEGGASDSWGPDFFTVVINGGQVFNETFSNWPQYTQTYGGDGSAAGTGSYAQDVTEYGNPTDYAYQIILLGMADDNGDLALTFIGNSNQAWGDEGFGIDNVSVSTVPVPAGLPLLLAGIGALGLMRRRKA